MLDENLAEAWVNSTHRVLGLKLRPFSLWHRFQLEIVGSPTLSRDTPITLVDLYRAALVCRLVYPQVISPKVSTLMFRWRVMRHDYQTELKKLGAYFSDFFAIPKFLPPTKKYRRTEVLHPPPENIQIYSAVLAHSGWPEEKIWNMPIGQAYWYAAGHWYQTGQELDFLTPEHLVLQQRIAAMKKGKENAS